jgi:hypothetical protein
MMKKLTLLFAVLAIGFGALSQGEVYQELYNSFGEVSMKMTSSEIKELAKNGEELPLKQRTILEERMMTDYCVVPVGKVVQGKSVIMIYMRVERKGKGQDATDISFVTKTLHKKSGELLGVQHHLLDIVKNEVSDYDGYFQRKDKDLIEFIQEDNKTGKLDTSVYEFDKKLKYVRQ